jgi:hypothetical protein
MNRYTLKFKLRLFLCSLGFHNYTYYASSPQYPSNHRECVYCMKHQSLLYDFLSVFWDDTPR